MTESLNVVVVSAGLRQPSSTRLLADRLAASTERALDNQGRAAQVQVIELRELATDIAHNLVTGFPNETLS
jgi:FMN reductase